MASSQRYADDLLDGEDRSAQRFSVYAIMPRNNHCVSWTCPITHADAAERGRRRRLSGTSS
jgi:hypothetical protein